MLTEEETKALERWRLHEADQDDVQIIGDALLRLYPPGWNDPVTPERLVELGGKVYANRLGCVSFDGLEFVFSGDCLTLVKVHQQPMIALHLTGKFLPRNMKEARELLERCGAIKEAT